MAPAVATSILAPPNPPQSCAISQITKPEEVLTHLSQLCQILQECVNEGSSIGFLAPLSIEDAETYWKQVSDLITKVNFSISSPAAAPSSDKSSNDLGDSSTYNNPEGHASPQSGSHQTTSRAI
jgi:hypothetical protein